MQAGLLYIADVLAINPDRTLGDIIKPEQQPTDGRLARSRGANKRHLVTRPHSQRNTLEDRACRVISEAHIVKNNLAAPHSNGGRTGLVHHLCRLAEKPEHLAHIHQSLPNFAVNRAQKVQRHGDLDHIGVDHHEIAHRQYPGLHTLGGHDHHNHQPRGDDKGLPGIQERQALPSLDRRNLIALHRHVITRSLTGFGVEILDGFKVQQTVHRLLVGVGVLIVHLAPNAYTQFGHFEGKGDVNRDRYHHHGHVLPTKQYRKQRRDHGQFQDQRANREQHKPQQEIDALHTAFDDAAQAAGLAGDVIAQGQRMDVTKRLQRQLANGALADTGKDRITRLAKGHRPQPRQTIGHRQAHSPQGHHPDRILGSLTAQHVDRQLVKIGRGDRDKLGHDQQEKRAHHAPLDPSLPLWPQIRQHTGNGLPSRGRRRVLIGRGGGVTAHG